MENFERLIAAERQKAVDSLLKAEDGDSHLHARIKGTISGLDLATRLYRESAKLDLEAA